MRLASIAIAVILLGVSFGQNASAQQSTEERFLACGTIENNSARLACFDAIILEKTEGTQIAPEALQEERERQSFGEVGTPTLEEPASVNVVLVKWTKGPTGNWTFETKDGQIWRQTDNAFLRLRGTQYTAIIKEGTISGYIMNIDGWSSPIRVRRIR